MKRMIVAAALAVLWSLQPARSQITGFDDITAWAGTGTNRAGLVMSFNDGSLRSSFAFGYRWNGSATGLDMLTALNGLFGLTLSSPSYVFSASFLDAVTGVTHTQSGGAFSNYPTDWISWGYFLAGGSATVFDSNPPYGPVGSLNPPGGGTNLPVSWTISPSGSADRQLVDGSWDAFSFGEVNLSFEPTVPPAGTVFAAVPEPSSALLALVGVALILRHVRKRLHTA